MNQTAIVLDRKHSKLGESLDEERNQEGSCEEGCAGKKSCACEEEGVV